MDSIQKFAAFKDWIGGARGEARDQMVTQRIQ
jgi:hypothetical protein